MRITHKLNQSEAYMDVQNEKKENIYVFIATASGPAHFFYSVRADLK